MSDKLMRFMEIIVFLIFFSGIVYGCIISYEMIENKNEIKEICTKQNMYYLEIKGDVVFCMHADQNIMGFPIS